MYRDKSINTLFTMGFNSWGHRIICLFTLSYNLAAELQYYNVFQLQQKLYKIVFLSLICTWYVFFFICCFV